MTPLRPAEPAELHSALALRPDQIPPRQWLYGTILIRDAVTVLVAPGGTGKSLLALTVGASLAIGRTLIHDYVHQRVPVWILNLDDPLDELNRRFLALRLHYGLEEADFAGFLFLESGDERQLVMARVGEDRVTILHPDEGMVTATIKRYGIGLLIVDPYAETSEVDENSNSQVVHAVAAWRRIARSCNCAILLVHHVRKAAGGREQDIEASRGAKALTDSARVGLLMSSMSTSEAEALGIDEEDRHRFVRLDNAKSNVAPRPGVATWFEMVQVAIGNPTPQYPNGDRVATLVRWEPPTAWAGLDAIIIDRILSKIEQGPTPGEYYSPAKQAKDRWAGNVIVEEAARTPDQAKAILAAWKKNGIITETTYNSPERKHKEASRVAVNAAAAAPLRGKVVS